MNKYGRINEFPVSDIIISLIIPYFALLGNANGDMFQYNYLSSGQTVIRKPSGFFVMKHYDIIIAQIPINCNCFQKTVMLE